MTADSATEVLPAGAVEGKGCIVPSWPWGTEQPDPVGGTPMTSVDVLIEAYGRLPDLVRGAVEGLDADQLSVRPGGSANRRLNA